MTYLDCYYKLVERAHVKLIWYGRAPLSLPPGFEPKLRLGEMGLYPLSCQKK